MVFRGCGGHGLQTRYSTVSLGNEVCVAEKLATCITSWQNVKKGIMTSHEIRIQR